MMTFNPIVLLAAGALIMLVVYAFVSSTRRGFIGKKKGYELERVDSITSVEELEALLGENLSSPQPRGLLAVLPDSSDRYVRHTEREITELYGNNVLSRAILLLNRHLDRYHNVLVPWEYAFLFAVGLIGGGALGYFLLPFWWFALPMALTAGTVVAESVLNAQAKSYRERVNKQAISLIQLVIQGLRAGDTTPRAFERAARDLGDPIARDLEGLLRASRGQVSFGTACRDAIKDTSSTFLKKIYKVIIMCEASDLRPEQTAERLIVIRKGLLTEYSLKLSMKAAAAGSTMAGNFLAYLVPGLLFFLIKQSPAMLRPLIDSPAGWAVIVVGICLYAGGLYATKKTLAALEV